MRYELRKINYDAQNDTADFIARSEARYHEQIDKTAALVVARMKERPILFICGPSSSSKTTTALLLSCALEEHGAHAEVLSMDDYYRTRTEYITPKDDMGVDDLESPECMDLPLLRTHLQQLSQGKEIQVPHFDFARQERALDTRPMQLHADEIVVIEGIHALSDEITGGLDEKATALYLSVSSDVLCEDGTLIDAPALRFLRRAVRDRNFRAAPVETTLRQWRSVLRGEQLYILPYRHHATIEIDSYLPYETSVLISMMRDELQTHSDALRQVDLGVLCDTAVQFDPIDYEKHLPKNSLLHEFIG